MRAALLALFLVFPPSFARADAGNRVDVLSWFAMSPPQFGCWLEKTFGYRDPKWNCDLKGWKASGDPCEDVVPYTEGPELPEALAKRVDPRLRAISLEWEHGDLRSVILRFDGAVTERDARRAFGLPAKGVPAEFNRVSLQRCSRKGPCLTVEKFEHLGAGEAECGGDASERGD